MASKLSPETRVTAQPIHAAAVAAPPSVAAPVLRRPAPSVDLAHLIGAAVVAIAFVPLLAVHGSRLWALPHYQFFPMALFGALILAWSRWKDIKTLVPGNATIALAGVAAAWAMLAMSELIYASNLAVAACLLLLASLIYRLGGWALFRALLPAWIFLWILVPPPFGADKWLVNAMQTVTTAISSSVLDLFGVFHQLAGNVIEIPGRQLLVEEACAGVNSLYALLACGLFLALLLRRPWLRAGLLLVASVGWVLVCNVIRVTMIALAQDRKQIDLAAGWRHDFLGICTFLLAVLLIWSTDRLFLFFAPRYTDGSDPLANDTVSLPFSSFFGGLARRVAWPVAAAFALLLFVHLSLHGIGMEEIFSDQTILPSIAKIDKNSLDKKYPDAWTMQPPGYGETHRTSGAAGAAYGEFTKAWSFKREQIGALVALDYPFPGYHDLTTCYTNQGWLIEKSINHHEPGNPRRPAHYVEVKFKKSAFRSGYLFYAVANPLGEMMEPDLVGPTATFHRYEKAINDLKARLTRSAEAPRSKVVSPAYQFQVFAESSAPFTADEERAVQSLFFTTSSVLRKRVFSE